MNPTRRFLREARALRVPVQTRRQWGSVEGRTYALRLITRHHFLLPKKPVDTIWQHISVTVDDGTLKGDFFNDMKELERIGKARFGSGMSYNIGWDMQTGMVGLGMPFSAKGTHTVNYKKIPRFSYDQNGVAIAIVAIGVPGNRVSDRAKGLLIKTIAALILSGIVTSDPDYEPHSLVAAKDCPTDALREIMPEVLAEALKLVREIRNQRRSGIRVITHNIRNDLTDAKATADFLDDLSKNPDVLCLQEVMKRRASVFNEAAVSKGYANRGAIWFRKDKWRILDSGSHHLSDATLVGKPGAGPDTLRAKRAQWVELEHKVTGEVHTFINVHLAPSINLNEVRSDLHKQQISRLADFASKKRNDGEVTVCGDFNASHKKWANFWRFAPMRMVGLRPNWKLGFAVGPTFPKHNGYIDAVWTTKSLVSQSVDKTVSSDHRSLLVRIR